MKTKFSTQKREVAGTKWLKLARGHGTGTRPSTTGTLKYSSQHWKLIQTQKTESDNPPEHRETHSLHCCKFHSQKTLFKTLLVSVYKDLKHFDSHCVCFK